MKQAQISDSELVKLLKLEEKISSYSELGRLLGMESKYARTYVSDVSRGKKPLAPRWKMAIIEKFPKFSGKHLLIKDSSVVKEPEPTYSNQIKQKMDNYEAQLTLLLQDVVELKQKVAELISNQEQLLSGNSEQSEEAV